MRSLEGRVALVTGASRGIGRAIAVELALAGAKVALNYRAGEAAARSAAGEIAARKMAAAAGRDGGRAQLVWSGASARLESAASAVAEMEATDGIDPDVMLIQADVSDSEAAQGMVARVVERWGRLDILVNNAGITKDRTLKKLSKDDWQTVLNTNLNGTFYCASAAIPVMTDQKYGRIVNVGSMIAQIGAVGQANYAAAKGGMIAFTKAAAIELARHNITVNCVNPGYTATDMFSKVPAEIQDQIKARIPMGRFADPAEIAEAVLFLASGGDYITGQQINVNGGMYL